MGKRMIDKKQLQIAMLGHKRIPSREGGIEVVVEELSTILLPVITAEATMWRALNLT